MILTNWGYKITDINTLPSLISAEEFDEYTAGKFEGDKRRSSNLNAASNAVRNYCGWHVYPSTVCEVVHPLHDYSFIRSGGDIIVQLPARYVSAVSKVLLNAEYDNDTHQWTGVSCRYRFEVNGLLTIYDAFPSQYARYDQLMVEYTAGLPDELMAAIKELIAHRSTHALTSSNGIASETSGGVSITYSANWINSAKATALADDNKEVLQPYRVGGVF